MKSEFIQIRVTAEEKKRIASQAKRAGLDLSRFLLSSVSRDVDERFLSIVSSLSRSPRAQLELAELNDLLSSLRGEELSALPRPSFSGLSDYLMNFVTASVEYACGRVGAAAPLWVRDVPPLKEPVFGTTLISLRPYLLRVSPPPFRGRNIFIDASIGSRV